MSTPAARSHLAPKSLQRPDAETIAYCAVEGQSEDSLGVVWLTGFHSDMEGSKALALEDWAVRTGHAFVRFDYFGHGQSSGDFAKGTISRWLDDSLTVIDTLTKGPLILAGSSMGGWLATLAAMARPTRMAGIVYVAPAPDFTEDLMWDQFPQDVRDAIRKEGQWLRHTDYDPEPYPITKALIEDGRKQLVLRQEIPISCPVRILHGMADADVPWQRSLTLAQKLQSTDVVTCFVKHGDHRLSDDLNIGRLVKIVDDLAQQLGAPA